MAIDFKLIESQAKEIWKNHLKEINNSIKEENPDKKPIFSFLEGPPTANAPPGLHHLEVRAFKDIVCRYKQMKGFKVPRKGGWDCHGLPVEVQVEKSLNLNSKKEILDYGQENFIKKCKDSVFSNIGEWNKSTEEFAYLIDLENPYRTLDNNYIESVWWSLKELYNKNYLYEGYKIVPFCPRCSTPLSSHEVSQGYKEVKEKSVIVKFQLEKDDRKVLVWTTTPWTLPSNLAIAINPNLTYVTVGFEKEKLILVKELVDKYFEEPKILEEFSGKELLGKNYSPLMPYFEDLKKEGAFKIIGGDFVTTEDGTGIVHMAPAFGEVDYDACKENKIPFVQPVDQSGKFTSEIPDYENKFIKDCDKDITLKFDSEGKLFKILNYKHDYPFCWRCNSPLMYYAINSWFVKSTAVKERMIELNKNINWNPAHIKEGRFGMWLESIKDWNLSRFKFWGTPLPVWRCECGNEKIIGSIKELKENSKKEFTEYDLHRPWIDNIKLKCNCGKEMNRIKDVIDCWYDSGSAPFAQFHYPFENKDLFERRYPYDFISEGVDQTRGWFYTMHVLSTMLFDKQAYNNCICAGLILDELGEKMSKSKGNIIKPEEILNSVGVDATRMQFCTSEPGNSKRFSESMVRESVLPFLNILWNTNTYYSQMNKNKLSKEIEDDWIISKLNTLIFECIKDMDNFHIDKAMQKIIDFTVNDFSRTYIRLTREREDNKIIVEEVLMKIIKLIAPFAPHIAEVIYKNFNKNNLIYFEDFPITEENKINIDLEKEFSLILEIIEKGLKFRDKNGIGLKWPLMEAKIKIKNKIKKELFPLIKSQLNVKSISFEKGEELEVSLDLRMTPELESEGYAREISRIVQATRKKMGLNKSDLIKLNIFSKELKKSCKNQESFIRERTGSLEFCFVEDKNNLGKNIEEFKIKDISGLFSIIKTN